MKRTDIENGVGVVDLLGTRSGFLSSNGEARRDIKAMPLVSTSPKSMVK